MIERAAELAPADVVLEVGGGLGVLSEHLAERAAHVHVVEVDRRLEPPLRDALDPYANATLHFADAIKLDLAALDPAPTKVVANLPYGIAATVILRTIEELPSARRWVAMVQKEVGERLAARPGTRRLRRPLGARPARLRREGAAPGLAHGLPSRCRTSTRCWSGCTRRGPAPAPELRALVQQGFAHRRKALARSLSLASGGRRSRDRARAALEALGRPADVRAEPLAPAASWRALRRTAGRMPMTDAALPARSTSASSSARRATTACTRSSPSMQPSRWPTS